jgi:hypothetical protein
MWSGVSIAVGAPAGRRRDSCSPRLRARLHRIHSHIAGRRVVFWIYEALQGLDIELTTETLAAGGKGEERVGAIRFGGELGLEFSVFRL